MQNLLERSRSTRSKDRGGVAQHASRRRLTSNSDAGHLSQSSSQRTILGGDALGGSSFLKVLIHPSIFPKLVLQTVAGNEWLDVRRATQLFPLRFVDPEAEAEYDARKEKEFFVHMRVTAAATIFICISLWILGGIGMTRNWFETVEMKRVTYSFYAVNIVAILIQSFQLMAPSAEIFNGNLEWLYYACSTFAAANTVAWGLFCICYVADTAPYDPMNPFGSTALIQVKLFVDAITTGIMVLALVHMDIFLPCSSRRSLAVHVLYWVFFCVARLGQNSRLRQPGLKVANSIDVGFSVALYCIGWCSRWYRELQDRAVVIIVRTSRMNIDRIRDTQKARRRHSSQSAADEIIALINECEEVLSEYQVDDGDIGETRRLLAEAVQKLANQDPNAVEREEVDENAGGEDVFINMYNGAKKLDQTQMEVPSERQNRKQSEVSFGTITRQNYQKSEAPSALASHRQLEAEASLIGGVNVPEPRLADHLANQIGKDMGMSLLSLESLKLNSIVEVGWALLKPYLALFEISPEVLKATLFVISELYDRGNPFHNGLHAASVAHYGLAMLSAIDLFDRMLDIESVAFVMAGLAHDIGHPGRTNNFYVNANSVLALAQNDEAVLEAWHCFILSNVLGACPETDFLRNFNPDERKLFRKMVEELILATDMQKHFETISKSRVRRASAEFNAAKSASDRLMTMTMIFKAADLGHAALEWTQHLEWSLRLTEEYYQQGDDETSLSLPLSPLCDRLNHVRFPKTQSGYIQFVVRPLLQELIELDKEEVIGVAMMSRLLFNKQKWDAMASGNKSEEMPARILQMRIAHPNFTGFIVQKVGRATSMKMLVQKPTAPMMAMA